MKKSLSLIIVSLGLIFHGCNNNPQTKSSSNNTSSVTTSTTKNNQTEDVRFGAGTDTTTPPLESFKKFVTEDLSSPIGNEFYTEKNYQGEKIVQSGGGGWANYQLEEGIVIKSMKLQPGYQVSFDFGSECNAIEKGHFRYYSNSMPDILANCGCDENFSQITEIYVRWTPDRLKNAIQVWEKPYLLGKGQNLMGPTNANEVKLYKWKDFGFPTASSIQIPKGMLVNLYKDEYFKDLLIQINTSNNPVDKLYFLTSYFTHAEFKSLSIANLK